MSFNPLPLTEARGDRSSPPTARRRGGFNPLPSPKQGETPISHRARALQKVSIRSPHRSKGRPLGSKPILRRHGFQSAPLTEARGDLPADAPTRRMVGFNPLPSPKQGETGAIKQVFLTKEVSIRSPHRSKGRHQLRVNHLIVEEFQSAPLTEARGDVEEVKIVAHTICFNPLPSPKQGETNLNLSVILISSLFQSVPLTEARGDAA